MKSAQAAEGRSRGEQDTRPPCCTCHRITFICFLLVLAGGLTIGLLLFFGHPDGAAGFLAYGDPPGLSAANSWQTSGNVGLTLTVENAMATKYSDAFSEYVSRWDNGTPDALTLTAITVTPDVDCQPSDGRLKLCSGNYGQTDWRGINYNYIVGGYIQNSISKLNDYHLDSENDYQRRYTVCHEMGHGFGLAHTDENYFNLDRGDCLDYTVRPERNLDPGAYNYGILQKLYGAVVTRNRHLRGKNEKRSHRELTGELKERYDQALKDMEGEACPGHICVVDLGDDIQVVTHKLRVI